MFVTSFRARVARRSILAAIAGGALVLGAAKPWSSAVGSAFGGPWISIETPVNPSDPSTRGALLLVHTFHHGTPLDMAIAGKAEGLVDGQRRSIAFTATKSSKSGTYGVHKQWGDKGIWTLLITATTEHHGSIQAVVNVGADGEVERVRVPRDARTAPRMLTVAEVDADLRARAKAPVAVGAR